MENFILKIESFFDFFMNFGDIFNGKKMKNRLFVECRRFDIIDKIHIKLTENYIKIIIIFNKINKIDKNDLILP